MLLCLQHPYTFISCKPSQTDSKPAMCSCVKHAEKVYGVLDRLKETNHLCLKSPCAARAAPPNQREATDQFAHIRDRRSPTHRGQPSGWNSKARLPWGSFASRMACAWRHSRPIPHPVTTHHHPSQMASKDLRPSWPSRVPPPSPWMLPARALQQTTRHCRQRTP
jgi:hypothetical protein